jgi:hypothetical protein
MSPLSSALPRFSYVKGDKLRCPGTNAPAILSRRAVRFNRRNEVLQIGFVPRRISGALHASNCILPLGFYQGAVDLPFDKKLFLEENRQTGVHPLLTTFQEAL